MTVVAVLGAIQQDADQDGLPNSVEVELGLNPASSDSDGDTVLDGDEDYDGDGLANSAEVTLGTDPAAPDTDADGRIDGMDNCPQVANPSQTDSDEDGVGNACETDEVSPFTSALRLDREAAMADGVDAVTLTVIVRDAQG